MSSYFVRTQVEGRRDALHVRSLLDTWGLRQPLALIAVTGGAQDFDFSRRMEEVVFQGILQAATAAQASIIDGGTDAGVMKLLGKAVQRSGHRHGLIGMTSWGCVIGREVLARDRIPYVKTQPSSSIGAGLDPNHTFFVLFDNGTVGLFGEEILALARLEALLRNTRTFKSFQRILRLSLKVHFEQQSSEAFEKKIQCWPVADLLHLWKYWNGFPEESNPGLRVEYL
jgi:hypothetical protein